MPNYNKIKSAILEKRRVSATYNNKIIEVCPYVLGIQKGSPKALFYNGEGIFKSDNWQCIFIKELNNIELMSDVWHPPNLPVAISPCIMKLILWLTLR